jgi:hypothetical protein
MRFNQVFVIAQSGCQTAGVWAGIVLCFCTCGQQEAERMRFDQVFVIAQSGGQTVGTASGT